VTGGCERCGRDGRLQAHHPSGRQCSVPFHPGLVEDLCLDCHQSEHQVWRRAGLDVPATPIVKLKRLAVWLSRRTAPLTVDSQQILASAIEGLADEIGTGQ
jgi:hypothetical protein